MNLPRIAHILENKNDLIVREVILDVAQKKKQIIYGARAFNVQSPDYLRKKTTDYDILTKTPKKSALEVAKELSRRLGEDIKVVKGIHKGTYKVKLNGETIVDYTQLKRSPKIKSKWGNQYRDIKSIKRNAQRLLKNPKTEHRREKDIDTLKRIQEIERIERIF